MKPPPSIPGEVWKEEFETISRTHTLEKLLLTAKLLYRNAAGCAVNHYGHDFKQHGMPGWLADAERDIAAAEAVIKKARAA
jgi:hypothetical protein